MLAGNKLSNILPKSLHARKIPPPPQERNTENLIEEVNKLVPKNGKVNWIFSFKINGKKEKVYKTFFLSKLSVGEPYVDHALRNSQHGSLTDSD